MSERQHLTAFSSCCGQRGQDVRLLIIYTFIKCEQHTHTLLSSLLFSEVPLHRGASKRLREGESLCYRHTA